jgi:hypothetical protein
MSLLKRLVVVGAAAEAARRFARNNPEKARQLVDKAAQFADQQTKGKYSQQIDSAKRMLADLGGFAGSGAVSVRAGAVAGPGITMGQLAGGVASAGARPTPYKRG